MSTQTWPEHAMTAGERKALRNELPGYAPRLVTPYDLNLAAQQAAEARSKRLDRVGTVLGGLALGISIPLVFGAFIWLLAG